MAFEWEDDKKAISNLSKHGVSFELAREVWNDPLHVILPDRVQGQEQRWHAVGTVGAVVILVVAHSHPELDNEDRIRIISARKATSHEGTL
ncbi:BrnT family toxin [Sphingomonas sp. PAMC 26617]|uniref:BrnT family toxin n=1 Tax=Sphingomonas sp. PAMC 26617 TaxID=1112216 RepID=UPI0004961425|nr:BrnT family toxin [Sphingomonas sp. PAMC 26617]